MAEGEGGAGPTRVAGFEIFMECKVWVFGKGCSVAPGRGRGGDGDEDGRARAGYPRDFGGGHGVDGGRVGQGPSLLRHLDRMERAWLANATLVQGSWQTGGWRREVSESTPEVSRPSLSPRAALGLCLSSRELRAAAASHPLSLGPWGMGVGVGVVGGRTDRGHVSSVAVREERGR